MTIINQKKSAVINYGHVQKIYIGADNKSLKLEFRDGSGCQIGVYPSVEKASAVLRNFLSEVAGGAATYELPPEDVKL